MASTPPRKAQSSLPFGSSASVSAAAPNIRNVRRNKQLPYNANLRESRVLATSNVDVLDAKDKIKGLIGQLDESGKLDEAATKEAKELFDKYFLTIVYTNQINVLLKYLHPKYAKRLIRYLDVIEEQRMAQGYHQQITIKDDILPFLAPKRTGGRRKTRRHQRR